MNEITFDLSRPALPVRREHVRMGGTNPRGETISVTSHYLEWNGQPWLPIMGEFQYSRHPCRYWEEGLRKIHAAGVEIVPTYVLWNHHEEVEGVFDWSEDRDLRRFVELCQRVGLWVVVRMGPFCHGEARNGGLPDWLYGQPFEARSNDPRYLRLAKRLYGEIAQQIRGLTFAEGGPIIGIQCDNEYDDSAAPWETTFIPGTEFTPKGSGGAEHLLTLKRYAAEAGISVPLYTATGWGATTPIIPEEFLPMYGGYAFFAWLDDPASQGPSGFLVFRDQHRRAHPRFDPATVPFACCEIGGGIQPFYRNRPHVPPESVEAMHVVQLGSGSNIMGYYVFHGGTNPTGKHSFLNEHRCPRKSYDFQAPIREFGQLNASYHRLRRQFLFLRSWGAQLAPMETALEIGELVKPEDTTRVRAALRTDGESGFIFVSNYQDHVEMREHLQVRFRVGDLSIPATGYATVQRDACAILPVGMWVGAIRLISATVAPLTRLQVDGVEHIFFRSQPGFTASFVIDGQSLAQPGADQELPARPGEPLRLMAADGSTTILRTLSDEDSLACWRLPFAGAERVIICRDGLMAVAGGLELSVMSSDAGELLIFPALASPPTATGAEIEVLDAGEVTRLRWRSRIPEPTCQFENLAAGRMLVTVPPEAFDGLEDLFLSIDAIGDIGEAYIDGILVHDWFLDGRPWLMGLKRFIVPGRTLAVVLTVTPPRGESNVTYSQMAAMEVKQGGTPARIVSVRLLVERRLRLVAG